LQSDYDVKQTIYLLGVPMIKFRFPLILLACLMLLTPHSYAAEDSRQLVKLPEMMQAHMLANMRDHLQTLNQILIDLGDNRLDQAAELAEARLGMSSLELHGAAHMAKFMPKNMRQAGTAMHRAASRFARKAQEGDVLPAYRALSDVTSACVACHAAYRIH
jgi:hypothetical protein